MSNIEWKGKTWNPTVGCSRKSGGCKNCYAEVMTKRLEAMGNKNYVGLLNEQGRFNGVLRLNEDNLLKPLSYKKPQTFFVNSMSDLFHENVKDEWIDKVFAVMALTPQHTYQILTKRADRMRDYFNAKSDEWTDLGITETMKHFEDVVSDLIRNEKDGNLLPHLKEFGWFDDYSYGEFGKEYDGLVFDGKLPLSNVYFGVSVENKNELKRINVLRTTLASIRFLSLEPLLEDLGKLDLTDIDWVIVGGESGTNARPCDIAWIRSIVEQCKSANVACFVKQISSIWAKENKCGKGDILRFPKDIQIREFPNTKIELMT